MRMILSADQIFLSICTGFSRVAETLAVVALQDVKLGFEILPPYRLYRLCYGLNFEKLEPRRRQGR